MIEKNITRTFIVTVVDVKLYNKATKDIEMAVLKAIDIPAGDLEKWVTKKYKDCDDMVVLDINIQDTTERKYAMSLEDFIKYGKEV